MNDNPPMGGSVYIRISTSSAVNASGEIGEDVTFALLSNQWSGGPVTGGPTTWAWSPTVYPGSYPWVPGTYYWQAEHVDCSIPGCNAASAVWSFVVTSVPAPQPVSPGNGATVTTNSTVTLTVSSALSGDLGTRIVFGNGQQITPYGYGIGSDANDSYFKIQIGSAPGTLVWTPARADCKLASSCPLTLGPTQTLIVVAPATTQTTPPTSTPPRPATCRRGYNRATIRGRHVCLHAGEFCSHAAAAQYRRYGFWCAHSGKRYRLTRRHPSHHSNARRPLPNSRRAAARAIITVHRSDAAAQLPVPSALG